MFEDLARPVSGSKDLDRIVSLPRRSVNPAAYINGVTNALLKQDRTIVSGVPSELNATQAWALYEISRVHGLIGAIGVGHGKTGLDILTPLVVPDCRTCALLLPASLREGFTAEFNRWSVNFRTPNLFGQGSHVPWLPTIYPLSYDSLSREKSFRYLEELAPDLIIADEVHCLRDRNSTRTWRVLNYFAKHPKTRFCGWSGTLTSKSIKDYAHLSALALKNNSPLPLLASTTFEWSRCLDANIAGFPAPPGALSVFDMGQGVRDGFSRRVRETLGFVATSEKSSGCSVYILERKISVPSEITKALEKVREEACRPDGEQFVEASQVARCAKELASGFYYKWVFPRGEDKQTIDRWLEVRKEWHKELREKLKDKRLGLDSPLLCCKAAIRHAKGYVGDLPVWDSEWFGRWIKIKNTVQPQTEPVWVSEFLLEDLVKDKKEKRIVWYDHDTYAPQLRKHGFKVFDSDTTRDVIENESGTFAANIRSHGTGKNLQYHHSVNVLANYPTAHAAWEQLIGRTDRFGQKADEVIVSIYRHTTELKEAFFRARAYAKYQSETLGLPMKLLQASYGFDPEEM